MHLELISQKPETQSHPTPLLFIHGACHAAWCWENFLPYFARHGYEAHAVSLRGHGASDGRERIRDISIREYVEDVIDVTDRLSAPPVLIGHSMGGYVVQKYLEIRVAPAAVLLASVPVSGVLGMLIRVAIRHPGQSLRFYLARSPYILVETPDLAREAFFSDDLPDETVLRHFKRLRDESFRVGLESSLLDLPRPDKMNKAPILVLGAANDRLLTPREMGKTARAYGTEAVIFPGMAHDMMLEPGWELVADRILEWLKKQKL